MDLVLQDPGQNEGVRGRLFPKNRVWEGSGYSKDPKEKLNVGQYLPTLPTMRSLPRKKRKSVTLSKTATLGGRER